jgi:hypothetical protein
MQGEFRFLMTTIGTAALLWTATGAVALEASASVGGVGGAGASVGGGGSASSALRRAAHRQVRLLERESGGGAAAPSGSSGGEEEPPASAPARSLVASTSDRSSDIALPPALCPTNSSGSTRSRTSGSDPGAVPTIEGIAPGILKVCRETVAQAGQSYGMVNVTVASYGQPGDWRAAAGPRPFSCA